MRRRVQTFIPGHMGSRLLTTDDMELADAGLSEYTSRRACDECGVIEDVRITTDYREEWWTCLGCDAEHTEIV